MSNTGMTRELAACTIEEILNYIRYRSSDPLTKVSRQIFGMDRENEK